MMQGHALKPRDAIAARVYPLYQQQLLTANAVDFDDLLREPKIIPSDIFGLMSHHRGGIDGTSSPGTSRTG